MEELGASDPGGIGYAIVMSLWALAWLYGFARGALHLISWWRGEALEAGAAADDDEAEWPPY